MTRQRFMAIAAGAAVCLGRRAQLADRVAQIGMLYPGVAAVAMTRIAAWLRAIGYLDA
jgi:hypothetical protein